MFQLDPKPFQAQLNAARGELESQQARLATAQVTYGRVKPLAEQDALPQTDLDRAKGELDAAQAAVFSAQAKVDEAQLNLGYATITSPLTGVASRALQRQGAYVNSLAESANLTYVAALDPIWVNFSISQNQMARYKELQDKGQVVPPKDDNFDVELVLPGGASTRSAARSASPIRRSARTRDRSWCARCIPNPEVRPAARHVRDRARDGRDAAERDRRAAACRAAGQQRPSRVRREREQRRGNPAGGRRRLLRRQGHRDPRRASPRAIASSSTAC